jgi:DNA-binding transcriptional MerR regulator
MNDKASDAFKTISEVSALLDVPSHVLRFWEGKFSGLRPLKRSGGRRYYRPHDVEALRRIQHLLYVDGFTIKGAQKLLRSKKLLDVSISGEIKATQKLELLNNAMKILDDVGMRLLALKQKLK